MFADVEILAGQAANGDRAALDTLLREIQPDVLRRCGRLLPHRQDAEEACQDALLQVARHINTFAGRSKFSTWLYPVVSNCARQTYRVLKRRGAEQGWTAPPEVVEQRTTSVIAGSRIDLLEALDKLERAKPELVAPIVLRELSQLTYPEVAEQLGIPLSTVKMRIHDGRKLMRTYLS